VNAVKYLRKNAHSLGIDPDKIGIFGGSAGGTLASMVALTNKFNDKGYPGVSSRVKVLVDIVGITDLFEYRKKPELKIFSPLLYVHKNAPPTLIIHGNRDP
jgi:acetyl esterase/lipase